MDEERKNQLKQLLRSATALQGAMRESAASPTGTAANVGRYSSYKTFMRKYNEVVKLAVPLLTINTTILDSFTLDTIKDSGNYTWPQEKELFDSTYSNLVLLQSLLENAIGYAEDETHSLTDFIEANLRKAIFKTPEKEVDVQNAVESLLIGRSMVKGIDYDRETGRVKS